MLDFCFIDRSPPETGAGSGTGSGPVSPGSGIGSGGSRVRCLRSGSGRSGTRSGTGSGVGGLRSESGSSGTSFGRGSGVGGRVDGRVGVDEQMGFLGRFPLSFPQSFWLKFFNCGGHAFLEHLDIGP